MLFIQRVIFFILAVIAISGSLKSLWSGANLSKTPLKKRPTIELDNVYRFMSGLYLGVGIICLWMSFTMETQDVLVYLIALTIFLAGSGRIVSVSQKGVPNTKYYFYFVAELILPIVIVFLQWYRNF